ncbi:MAG: hypothetical protein SGJ20_18535 [Planctomycetota bacterium]|nr:hypothetical protein [Planctomycetota bacterium]
MSAFPSIIGAASSAIKGISQTLQAARGANPTARATPAQPVDTLEISAAGEAAASATAGLFGIGQAKSVEEVRSAHSQSIAALQEQLQELFRQNGIPTEPPVRITTDASGQLSVEGDHPQKEAIEKLLKSQPELQRSIAQLQSQAQFLQAAELAEQFQKRYAEDPVAATQWLQQAQSSGQPAGHTLILSGDQLTLKAS